MKKNTCATILKLSLFMLLQSATMFTAVQAEKIMLQADNFEHIQFKKISPSRYSFHDQVLRIDVDASASFLMLPFTEVKKISSVSFQWRKEGMMKIDDALHETQKKGDDAVFKLGLLLKSENSAGSFFLPAWMKQVAGLLDFPSERMINLVADAKNAAGSQWPNPYNERTTTIATASAGIEQGWTLASHRFELPVEVVALWLMADGDNTGSVFTTYIKNIQLQ